jgi:orotidine-5'-phosphate decarboxylase
VGWNRNNNVLLVAGATYIEELARIRETVGDMTLLVPGVGAQGGDLAAVLEQGSDANGYGLIINAARSILYADAENAGAGAAGEAAKIVDEMRRLQRKVAPDRAMV